MFYLDILTQTNVTIIELQNIILFFFRNPFKIDIKTLWCLFYPVILEQKLLIQKTYHTFPKIRYPKDFKNSCEAYSEKMSQESRIWVLSSSPMC